jgi:LuxR family transcriptional regulator, maltose regulon positive regulatory protein
MGQTRAGPIPSSRTETPAPATPTGLEIPAPRPGSIPRVGLLNRLRASANPVVTVLAPPGYGKSTLLAQWAERDGRPFAWLVCEKDDARGLCVRIASALARVGAIDETALASVQARRGTGTALRDLLAALIDIGSPVVLVLDGVDLCGSKGCSDVIGALALHVPRESTLVLAGRSLRRGPVARLRAEGRLLEIGADDLSFSRRDVNQLLRGLHVELDRGQVDELIRSAEGWPAGVYLAGLAIKDQHSSPGVPGGDDRFVTDYFDFETFSRLSAKEIRFLTRTSVLDSLCGPLCDAVLEVEGSGRKLEALDQSNLFLVPLDRRRRWYRYHREFREFLRAELERREPKAAAALYARASDWCEENGRPEAAIAYAHDAGNVDRVATLVGRHALAAWAEGKREVVETWLGWFDESDDLGRHPEIAVLEAWVHAVGGRPSASDRWLALAERATLREPLPDGSASIEPWLAVVRAAHCCDGPERMRADAELALSTLGPASGWRPSALVLRGAAHLLLGENDLADAAWSEAAEEAESVGLAASRIVALSQLSLLAAARGDEARSDELGLEARALVADHGLEGYVRSALALAVSARREAQRGNLDRARSELTRAEAVAPQLTRAFPWYSVQSALELTQVHLSILDLAGAREWLALADPILRRRPRLGVLVDRRAELAQQLERIAAAHEGRASTLTPAELRLLPLLATYLSFREIGEHLFISRNTVKTQAISVYRKLGVSSRSDAIERAGELGLVDRAS